MYNPYLNRQLAAQREYQSDLWIQQNVPGGLNSKFISVRFKIKKNVHVGPMGRRLDNYLGGNPNPTFGQMYGGYPGYGSGYGYRRW